MLSGLIPITFILGGLIACSPYFEHFSRSTPTSRLNTAYPVSNTTAENSPTAQSATIRVEGETRQITLKQYKSTSFSTSFPANDFVTDQVTSGEGSATWFYAKQPDGSLNKDAYVQIFFPNHAATLEELRKLVVENRGLFLVNGWQVTGKEKNNLYPWASEKITFEQRSQNRAIAGAVFLGQLNGRVFYALKHYPGDFGDGFAPLADQILSHLAVPQPSQSGLSNQSQLALNGIGKIRLGMTVAEASLAAGVPLIARGEAAPGSSCRYVAPSEPEGLSFMLDGDRIVRIDVTSKSRVTSLSGAKIGDTEAQIKSLYPGQIEVTPHKYLSNGHYLTFVPKDPQDQANRLIFETDGSRVTAFRSGKLPEVSWVEGCS